MSHAYVEVHAIPSAAVPRGAVLVDLVLSALGSLFRLAPARPLSRAEEAAGVRELARSMLDTDPSFAADLMAAAARHEGLDDIAPRR